MVANMQHSAESDGSAGPATNARSHLEQPTRRSTRASKRHQQVTEAQRDHKSASVSSSTPGSVGARELDDLDLGDDPRIPNEAASPMPHSHGNTAGDDGACITAIPSNTEGLVVVQEQAVSQDDVRTDEPSARNDLECDTASEPALKKAKTLTKQEKGPAIRRKSRSKWDSPLEMLTNQNSPLGKAELRVSLDHNNELVMIRRLTSKRIFCAWTEPGMSFLKMKRSKCSPNSLQRLILSTPAQIVHVQTLPPCGTTTTLGMISRDIRRIFAKDGMTLNGFLKPKPLIGNAHWVSMMNSWRASSRRTGECPCLTLAPMALNMMVRAVDAFQARNRQSL